MRVCRCVCVCVCVGMNESGRERKRMGGKDMEGKRVDWSEENKGGVCVSDEEYSDKKI